MIRFPDWYTGGWAERMALTRDMLEPWLALCDPVPQVAVWLPTGYGGPTPIVQVYRGGLGAHGLFDPALVQLGVIGDGLDESEQLSEYCRQALLSWERGGPVRRRDGSLTQVHHVAEEVGPQLLPELNPDKRLVTTAFVITLRKPGSTPDYAAIRHRLHLAA